MRQRRLLAPMIVLLMLLSACGRNGRDDWQRWQEKTRGAAEIRFLAEICSRTETDALRFTGEILGTEESVTMTLRAPESLRGLEVVTRREGTELRVEDMSLSLTAGRPETLSPAMAGAILLSALREGHILYSGADGETARAAFSGPGDETVTLWRGPDGVPLAAEIARGERTELRLEISGWELREQTVDAQERGTQ